MKTMQETFPSNRFYLEKIENEVGSMTDKVVFRLDGYRYVMNVFHFTQMMNELDVDATEEIRRLPRETVDRRPLWKKDMDMRMGKHVDFRTPSNYPEVNLIRFKHILSEMRSAD